MDAQHSSSQVREQVCGKLQSTVAGGTAVALSNEGAKTESCHTGDCTAVDGAGEERTILAATMHVQSSKHMGSSHVQANAMPDLPPFQMASATDFTWGNLSGEDFSCAVHSAYSEAVHWRRNLFLVPSGSVGKDFVKELTKLFNAYAQASALESVALEAISVACCVLLQRPHASSKSKDHISALQRRLVAWREGDIDGLMREGRAIQKQLHARKLNNLSDDEQEAHNARIFAKLIFEGKIHSALRFLSDNHGGGVLSLDERLDPSADQTVRDVLRDKHPPKRMVSPEALITTHELPPEVHPVLFESLTGASIRSAALRTSGSAGPSGLDAAGWRRLCCSFHKDSADLCASIAAFARRICTSFVDPIGLQAFVSCRLVPLNKNPGVRPIGVCEVVRRLVGKAVMSVVGTDVVQAAGPLQLCAGQIAGCEAAVHAMRTVFADSSTDAVILVDAANAFNNLNRQVALHNIQFFCPAIAIILINCYRGDACLFVGNEVILSREGTTQGDPLAMAFFAIASVPLITAVAVDRVTQVWFADDAASGGKLVPLREWWNKLLDLGPKYGYFPNVGKTYLVVKPEKHEEARAVFQGTNITICQTGKCYLGGTLGSDAFALDFIQTKVDSWVKEIDQLSKYAFVEPHAAFAALTHGLIGRWLHVIRVVEPCAEDTLQPLETIIRHKLIPALLGQPPPNEESRKMLALPGRLGGLGIVDPMSIVTTQKQASRAISQPLATLILQASPQKNDILQAQAEQHRVKHRMRVQRRQEEQAAAKQVASNLPSAQRECMLAAQEKGVSSWVGAIPLERVGFSLHKGAFRDALALRYDWPLKHIPQKCTCGEGFSISHALICRYGGFQIQRHNRIRDLVASLLSEVCLNVSTEPELQPLTGELLGRAANKDEKARLDVRASDFWGTAQCDAFFDIRVFHPFASSYRGTQLSSVYRQHEKKKRAEYGQRVREIEHASFTPLVFTTGGGMAPEATVFFKRLASLISEKRNEPYSSVIGWIRCVVSFILLRSALVCVRGTRTKPAKVNSDDIADAVAGGRLHY